MTSDPTSAALRAGSRPRESTLATLPGFRTLRSPRFRTVLAGTLLIVAVVILGLTLARQAADPNGQFGIDFGDYRAASQRLASGQSPYAPEMLQGPVGAQGVDRYRYPPPFAQALLLLLVLPAGTAAVAWLVVQLVAAYGAVWLATGMAGARRSVERALWCGVAVACFLPVFDTLWKGNVSAVLALQAVLIAAGGALGGASLATAALLKVSPAVLTPLAFAGDRRCLIASLGAASLIGGTSFLLAPAAWADYVRVLPNLLAGDSAQASNLSPWAMLLTLGIPAGIATLVRGASLLTAVGFGLGGLLVARGQGGWQAAVALGTIAMLLLPSQLWYHYLLVLLPLAALSWGRASTRLRVALLAAAAAVSLGIAWLPLATLGGAALAGLSLCALWPNRSVPIQPVRVTL